MILSPLEPPGRETDSSTAHTSQCPQAMTALISGRLRQLPDPSVDGRLRHPEVADDPDGRLSALDQSCGVAHLGSVRIWRRPPSSLLAAQCMATELVMRSRLVSSSICAKAAITVKPLTPSWWRCPSLPHPDSAPADPRLCSAVAWRGAACPASTVDARRGTSTATSRHRQMTDVSVAPGV